VYAWYKSRGLNLYQGLLEIYDKYGYVKEAIDSFTLKGKEGLQRIGAAMDFLRAEKPEKFGNLEVSSVFDYENQVCQNFETGRSEPLSLPRSNVLYYKMASGSWFCIRPSGTEP
ncbi:MAG TPA: phosphoglucomutase, partial [Lachnospiraceae bacterium]|nr:phosphoglucomutase [Lachnospiraceae bacterium]